MPDLSVVMSVHNNAPTLVRAVESVLDQTMGDFEFIIINDGSTDGSPEILRTFAARDKRIVLVDQENTGLTSALIRGVAMAGGRYIARQDADDISAPERFECQMAFVPSYDIIAARSCREDGRPRPSLPVALLHRYMMAFRNPFYHGTLVFSKEVYARAGGYDAEFACAQDYDLMARMITRANARIKYLIRPLYRTSRSDGSISVARAGEQERFALKVKRGLRLYWDGVAPRSS